MARSLRVEYEGAIYHVVNRGDRSEDIYWDEGDREGFVKTLGEACGKAGWQVHAYCLMTNHFHLVIETPQPTLVAGMKWLLGTYTQRFNARHRVRGHLFAGRYKALVVDDREGGYLRTVCDYVHLNPDRAGMIPKDVALEAYRWSSYRQYLQPPIGRPEWLRADRLLGEHGVQVDNEEGRREFARSMEARRCGGSDEADFGAVRRGWHFGAPDFLERLGEHIAGRGARERHHADEVRESMRAKAERIRTEELETRGLDGKSFASLPAGDEAKVDVAMRIRRETTLTLRETTELLGGGSWRTLANAICKRKRASMGKAEAGMPGDVKVKD